MNRKTIEVDAELFLGDLHYTLGSFDGNLKDAHTWEFFEEEYDNVRGQIIVSFIDALDGALEEARAEVIKEVVLFDWAEHGF